MFLEIKKHEKFEQIKGFRKVSKEEILALHPRSNDIIAWTKGPRPFSRFSICAPACRYVYVKINDDMDDEAIKKFVLDMSK